MPAIIQAAFQIGLMPEQVRMMQPRDYALILRGYEQQEQQSMSLEEYHELVRSVDGDN